MLMFVDPPLQIVALPLITLVGLAFTVITALPVRSPAIEVQFASLKADTVKVNVVAGLTLATYGLALMPFTVTGVVPSV
jgi:hypothetical protein